MGVNLSRSLAYVTVAIAAVSIAACSGGMGTGTGLPAPPGYNPTPSAAAAAILREHTTAGAIYLEKDVAELKFPASAGFGFSLDLGEPGAQPTGAAHAKPTASPSPSPSTAPSPGPSVSPTAAAKSKAKSKPTPAPTPSGPRIDTKVTVFPQDAPSAPTPEPTGDTQSFAQRVPVVRSYMMSQTELKLSSLSAVHFKLPKDERPEGRGFTIAVFEQHKHRKYGLIAWEPQATLEGDSVTVDEASTPITLKKKMGYVFVLYGDGLEPTPVPRSYSSPGANPFVTPQPSGRPGFGSPFGAPTPYGGQPPYGQPTTNPYPH